MKFQFLIYAIQLLMVSGRSMDDLNTFSRNHQTTRISTKILQQRNELVDMLKNEMNSRYGFQISNTKLSRTLVYWMRAIL